MLYVVEKETDKILFRVDAWDIDCERKARSYIKENGLVLLDSEITFMGDMVMWVF